MFSLKKHILIVLFVVFTASVVYSQEASEVPVPVTDKLPFVVETILGALSAVIVEFIQKQKSALASLGIAVGVSAGIGIISSFILGVSVSDLPLFLVQVFAMATTVWATLFKGGGLNKLINK